MKTLCSYLTTLAFVLACSGPLFAQSYPSGRPPFPFTPSGGQALVHSGAWGCTITGETCTQTLGWTVTAGDFLVVYQGGGTCTGATLSGTAMTLDSGVIYILPNAPAATSLTLYFNSSNGSSDGFTVLEFSGLSATAGDQGTAALDIAGNYENVSTFTSGATYTNSTAGALVINCAFLTDASGITGIGASGSWVSGGGGIDPTTQVAVRCEYQLNAATGSYTGTGTSTGSSYGKVYQVTMGYK